MKSRGRPKGHRLSEETKARISKSKTGYRHSESTKEKIAKSVSIYQRSIKMDKDENVTLLGKLTGRRLFMPFNTVINGTWGYGTLLAKGHKITSLTTTMPTKSKTVDQGEDYIKIGTQEYVFKPAKRATDQLMSMPVFIITCAEDFDQIFPVLNKHYPDLVNNDLSSDKKKKIKKNLGSRNKPLIISSLITVRGGKTFFWERDNVGKKGKKIYKLVLISINGKDVKCVPEADQRRLAGKLVVDVCEYRQAFDERESCRYSLEN